MRAITPPLMATFALALAPIAHAEINCVELALILQSGASNFEQLKGEPAKDEKNVWRASFSLPGAGQCDVVWNDQTGIWYYSCADGFETEAAARNLHNANLAAVASCLSGWTRQPILNSSSPGKPLDSIGFTGAGPDSSLAAELELVEFDDKQAGKLWMVTTLIKRRPG